MDLNKVQIIGNITVDPEVRETPNGNKVANFNIATNRYWTDNTGNKQEKAEFHSIVIWGKLADIAEQYLTKGQKVYIEGRLETRNWDDQAGQKRYKTEIIAENMIMLGGRWAGADTGSSGSFEQNTTTKPTKTVAKNTQSSEINIEDVPF